MIVSEYIWTEVSASTYRLRDQHSPSIVLLQA